MIDSNRESSFKSIREIATHTKYEDNNLLERRFGFQKYSHFTTEYM